MVYLEDIPYITFNLELVAEHDGLTPNSSWGIVIFISALRILYSVL